MTERRILRLAGTGAIAFIVATAICTTSCSSKKPQSPGMDLTSMHLSPAPAGSCNIDAVKMCQVTGGLAGAAPSSQPATMPSASSYAAPNAHESVEFQIPLGQTIELKCYYDPQHNSISRADATAESALTWNSVEYMKQRGLCINK
ncbi:MAG: hypothetical protein WCE23_00475 [Candidatus Binatus sp.]|uniref:hypothetical protein n=1 Tax=Candidatus Binatus sp. TaxID=2811406 RepID=UPI003C719CB0